MLPVIAYNLLQSIELLANAARALARQRDRRLYRKSAPDRLRALARNPMLVTALNPVIGYEQAAAIAKRAQPRGGRSARSLRR